MQTADELKKIFQEGWNIPARVDNYVQSVARREFTEGETCAAWETTLREAVGGDHLRILDMGTGPGVFACLYVRMGHRCVGYDFSERMLAEARQHAARLKVDCEFVLGDAEAPPFNDGEFDVVSSRHLLFNLPRPGVALREWFRVLKPGGRLILIGDEPGAEPRKPTSPRVAAQRRTARLARGRAPGWNPKRGYMDAVSQCPLFCDCKPNVLRAMMEAVGLTDIFSCSTGQLYAARREKRVARPGGNFAAARPFVLVGVKPVS